MTTTLVIFFLTVQSSHADDTETAATPQAFDTIQFFNAPSGAWRIKTFATDQDVHAWSIGAPRDDIVALARSNTEKHYGDVLREGYILHSDAGIEGLRPQLAERGLSTNLEVSEAGFAFWAPEGTAYRTKTTPT